MVRFISLIRKKQAWGCKQIDMRKKTILSSFIGLLALLALWGAVPVFAADIEVTQACSLYHAIEAANNDASPPGTACAAGNGADRLILTGDISLTGLLPNITSTITIEGGNYSVSGADSVDRIFHLYDAASTLTVNDLTLTNTGNNESGGAAIHVSYGSLNIDNSSFQQHSGGELSAAVEFNNTGKLSISNSSFYDNKTVSGGALAIWGGSASIKNSTFKGNSGSAIYIAADPTVRLEHITIADTDGIGLHIISAASVQLYNSLIEKGTDVACSDPRKTLENNQSHNLISDNSCPAAANLDTPAPQLGAFTAGYYPLQASSPAIDAASSDYCAATDQRGVQRPVGAGCDIGAYEGIETDSDGQTAANAATSELQPLVDTETPTATPTETERPGEIMPPMDTETPIPTATNTPEPTATNTPEPTATNTPEPTATNTPEPTATNTPEPTATNTPEPTATNTPEPTATFTQSGVVRPPVESVTPATATTVAPPTATTVAPPTATNIPPPTATNIPPPTATDIPPPPSRRRVLLDIAPAPPAKPTDRPTALPTAPFSPCPHLPESLRVYGWNSGTQCQQVNAAGIGIPAIIERGFINAVDVGSFLDDGVEVCIRGRGKLLFLDAANSPRTVTSLAAHTDDDMTCTWLERPGTVVLIPDEAPITESCLVETTAALNFRVSPGGGIIGTVPSGARPIALERSADWLKVDFNGQQGWLSADYLVPQGSCPVVDTTPAPPAVSGTPLQGCMVRLTAMLNLRDAPNGQRIGGAGAGAGAYLTALERSADWFKVDLNGQRGWLSAEYLIPEGDCD